MEVYIAYWVYPEEVEESNGILGVFTDLKKAENSVIKDMKEYLGVDWHDKYFSDKDLVSDEEKWYYFVKESNIQWYVHKTKVR